MYANQRYFQQSTSLDGGGGRASLTNAPSSAGSFVLHGARGEDFPGSGGAMMQPSSGGGHLDEFFENELLTNALFEKCQSQNQNLVLAVAVVLSHIRLPHFSA